MRAALLFAFTLPALFAAGPSGPVAGWTLDARTATIRAITGLPGALRLADPLALPFGIAAAEFDSTGSTAAALTTGQPARLVILTSLATTPAIADLGEMPEGTRLFALTRKGTAALIYVPLTKQIRFATELATAPVLSAPIYAGTAAVGLLEESGTCALIGGSQLSRICRDGGTRQLVPDLTLNVTALAWANNDRDLWLADAAASQIIRLQDYLGTAIVSSPATVNDGIVQPVALFVSPSGMVLAADSGAQAIFAIDPSGAAALRSLPLDITPTQLRPLTDRSLLLLNDLSALPFTLLSTEAMRTYFVPAN